MKRKAKALSAGAPVLERFDEGAFRRIGEVWNIGLMASPVLVLSSNYFGKEDYVAVLKVVPDEEEAFRDLSRDFDEDATRAYRIRFEDPEPSAITFDARIQKLPLSMDRNGPIFCEVTFRVVGKIRATLEPAARPARPADRWDALRPWLVRLYEVEGRTTREIAEVLSRATGRRVSHVTVNARLAGWGVRRRGRGRDRRKDRIGERRGRLEVVARVDHAYPTRWLCLCSCGRSVEVPGSELRRRRSCGCAGRRRA